MPFLSLLGSKLGIYAMIAVAVVAGGLWMLHLHDNNVRAAMDAKAAQAIAAQAAADQARINAAIKALAVAKQAQAVAQQRLRDKINAEPHSSACANSPAMRDALRGLRGGSSGAVTKGKTAG